jgi:purine-binding chemotaxis protein CheW
LRNKPLLFIIVYDDVYMADECLDNIIRKNRGLSMNTVAADENRSEKVRHREGKYLTFTLAGEEYGIGILKVKEIIGIITITAIPQTPPYIKGVINLRGKVIPVIDLRLKFGMSPMEYTERTCIIVIEVSQGPGYLLIGILVDSVSEVLNIKGADIEDTPNFGTQLNTDFILGMAKAGGGIKILLDIDRVMNADEVAALENTI